MRTQSLFLCLQMMLSSLLFGSTPKTELWQTLVTKHLDAKGGVNYISLSQDKDLEIFLDSYKTLATKDLKSWNDNQKKAFYINFYNATMMFNLLKYAKEQKIPVESSKFMSIMVNDVSVKGGNIWNGEYKVSLAGKMINLDGIEHGLIRGQAVPDGFEGLQASKLDPRIHAAVNCAALSCPRVREKAYTPDNVEKMLTENMQEFLNSEEQFRMQDDTLHANSIVFWYYPDFDAEPKGAGTYLSQFVKIDKTQKNDPGAKKAAHLKEYFDDTNRLSLKLSSRFDFDYNWAINDQRNHHLRSKS